MVGCQDNQIHVYDTINLKKVLNVSVKFSLICVHVIVDLLICGMVDGYFQLLDLKTSTVV